MKKLLALLILPSLAGNGENYLGFLVQQVLNLNVPGGTFIWR